MTLATGSGRCDHELAQVQVAEGYRAAGAGYGVDVDPGLRHREQLEAVQQPGGGVPESAGTGAFWNSTTRLLDGFKLFSVPETGINIDAVPGPRGPVTFRDLYLRQFVVTPA